MGGGGGGGGKGKDHCCIFHVIYVSFKLHLHNCCRPVFNYKLKKNQLSRNFTKKLINEYIYITTIVIKLYQCLPVSSANSFGKQFGPRSIVEPDQSQN